ncbi:hypothetical protein [Thioalkalivibrio sp. HK1]|uniref:hypothetical protein n=1 Tax=Thioalkalivibrio sp. HK1 TaxID=1469245 RepID=UPI00047080D8|nr:hypothetical protein [Thioalkalivibrio sp. HK1]
MPRKPKPRPIRVLRLTDAERKDRIRLTIDMPRSLHQKVKERARRPRPEDGLASGSMRNFIIEAIKDKLENES